jgi:hypothetical protein
VAIEFADFIDRDDMFVLEPGLRLCFVPKTIGHFDFHFVGQDTESIALDHLERDDSIRLLLTSSIDHRHPTAPNLFKHFVVAEPTNRMRVAAVVRRAARDRAIGVQEGRELRRDSRSVDSTALLFDD